MQTIKILLLLLVLGFSFKSSGQRVPAEWEKQDGIIITWFYEDLLHNYSVDDVHLTMVKNLVEANSVYINYQNNKQKNRIENLLCTNNLSIENIKWIKTDTRMGAYPRDFGPEWIYNNNSLNVVDMNWTFYGYIPHTRTFAGLINHTLENYDNKFAVRLEMPVYATSKIVSEGGGKEFNGNGILMVIEQTELARNPTFTKQQIETEYKRVFNLKKIIWLPKPSYEDENMFTDYIIDDKVHKKALRSASANGHIDEFCRFVSSNTILLAEVTQEEANSSFSQKINKARLDICFKILSNETDADGKPFKIVRIPVAEPIYLEAPENSRIYKNIIEMKRIVQLESLLDGSSFLAADTICILPALSYCNFSIANNVVLIAKYWKPGMPEIIKDKDKQALSILQDLFPERKIIAIETLPLNIGGGGLHCNTRHIPCLTEK